MEATGERFIPGAASWLTHEDHFARYSACLDACSGRIVLDAACGSGYGSEMLASVATFVHGVDVDPEAVEHATKTYGRPNTQFHTASVASLPLEDDSVDVAVSFETLEHIPADAQEQFMDEVSRVLRPDGVFVISTPDRLLTEERGTENEFHVRELTEAEFREMLGRRFDHVELYHQNMWAYNEILPANESAPTVLEARTGGVLRGQNMIAVCGSTTPLPQIGVVRRTDHGVWDMHAAIDTSCRQVADSYEATVSWRVTAPLRFVRSLIRRS